MDDFLINRKYSVEEINSQIKNAFGYPCVIKPNDEGSTVGLTILNEENVHDLENALELAFSYTNKILAEEYIKGREITVPVIGEESYPVIEIIPKEGYYDYEHKYSKGKTEYMCPAEIDQQVEIKAKEIAIKAHKILGCEVYSRVDFIL